MKYNKKVVQKQMMKVKMYYEDMEEFINLDPTKRQDIENTIIEIQSLVWKIDQALSKIKIALVPDKLYSINEVANMSGILAATLRRRLYRRNIRATTSRYTRDGVVWYYPGSSFKDVLYPPRSCVTVHEHKKGYNPEALEYIKTKGQQKCSKCLRWYSQDEIEGMVCNRCRGIIKYLYEFDDLVGE